MIFLLCVVVGSAASLGAVLDYSDVIIFGMIITNTTGLLILSSDVRDELASYLRRLRSKEIRRTR